jgi:hypothetical protein
VEAGRERASPPCRRDLRQVHRRGLQPTERESNPLCYKLTMQTSKVYALAEQWSPGL